MPKRTDPFIMPDVNMYVILTFDIVKDVAGKTCAFASCTGRCPSIIHNVS